MNTIRPMGGRGDRGRRRSSAGLPTSSRPRRPGRRTAELAGTLSPVVIASPTPSPTSPTPTASTDGRFVIHLERLSRSRSGSRCAPAGRSLPTTRRCEPGSMATASRRMPRTRGLVRGATVDCAVRAPWPDDRPCPASRSAPSRSHRRPAGTSQEAVRRSRRRAIDVRERSPATGTGSYGDGSPAATTDGLRT